MVQHLRLSLPPLLVVVSVLASCGDDASNAAASTSRTSTTSAQPYTDVATFDVEVGTTADEVQATADVMDRRLERMGLDRSDVTVVDGAIEVSLVVHDDATAALVLDELGEVGKLELRPVLSSVDDLGPATPPMEVVGAEAVAGPPGEWSVAIETRKDGIDVLNAAAVHCYRRDDTCPTGQLAIVLDGEVQAAPQISQPSYERDQIQITADYDEREAKRLARLLADGALPVPVGLRAHRNLGG